MAVALGAIKRWPLRIAIGAVLIVALLAVVATRGAASQDGTYRTAEVTTGNVTQTLTATGSVASASRYDLVFQVAGTVDSVEVAAGDTVEAGDRLASIDISDLEDAVAAAEDALAEANTTLSDDLEAQSNGTSSGSSSSAGSPSGSGPSTDPGGSGGITGGGAGGDSGSGSGGSGGSPTSPDVDAEIEAVQAAQQQLLEKYQVATAALAAAKEAQATAETVCAAFTDMESTDEGAAEALAQCQQATQDALAAQQESADAQSALMDAADALNAAVTDLLNALDGTATASPAAYSSAASEPTVQLASFTTSRVATSQVATATDDPMGGTASGNSGSSNAVPSAEDILADSAAVSAAEADLAVAQQQLEYSTLSAPVAGTVIAVGFAEGDSVSAGDTTTAITLIADNSYLVEISVGLSSAKLLEVGQSAHLTLLNGSTADESQVVDGTVSSVSNVNSGNSFSQAYAVTISVPDPGFEIRLGTSTRMEITVASAASVLVVPTSAVADAAGQATVQVIGEDGTATAVNVTVGAIGPEVTQIVDGLEEGQRVVLADLSIEPGTDDDSSSTGGLLSGLGEDTSTQQGGQFPGGGNFQPPEGVQFPPGGGFGGGQG